VCKSDSWKLFLRYQAQVQRNHINAVAGLDRLIAMRDRLDSSEPVCDQRPPDLDPGCLPHKLNKVFRDPAAVILRNEAKSQQATETNPDAAPAEPATDPEPGDRDLKPDP
jgi:hypothetical protein